VEDGSAAPVGEAEDARPVPVPPGAPAALPWLIRWRMCVHLDRLARELNRAGWSAAARYGEMPPAPQMNVTTPSAAPTRCSACSHKGTGAPAR
jgi:hypothetical protein